MHQLSYFFIFFFKIRPQKCSTFICRIAAVRLDYFLTLCSFFLSWSLAQQTCAWLYTMVMKISHFKSIELRKYLESVLSSLLLTFLFLIIWLFFFLGCHWHQRREGQLFTPYYVKYVLVILCTYTWWWKGMLDIRENRRFTFHKKQQLILMHGLYELTHPKSKKCICLFPFP